MIAFYSLILFAATLSAAQAQNTEGSRILNTLPAWEQIQEGAINARREQSIRVAENVSDSLSENDVVPFCNLAMLMPFTAFRPDRIPVKNGVFQGAAAVLLAMEHLNTGNGTIVQEVEGLNDRCDIRFTGRMLDSALSQTEAVDQVITLISEDQLSPKLPCAVIGAARSAVSIPTSIITGLRGFPQISPISTSTQLDDASQFPLFGRTLPSDSGTAIPAILYLRYELGVKHLAILHVNDAYGNAYALGLQLAAAEYAPDMVLRSYDFPFEATPAIVERTIALLKDTEFRYFFGIIFSTAHYVPFMTEAFNQGIAGTGEHNWMFSDSVSTSIFAEPYVVDSPLHLVSKGATRIGAVGGVPGIERYDLFLQSMNDLNNPDDIAYLQSKHPVYEDDPAFVPLQIAEDPEFFYKSTAGVVPFLYDAVIALGLAACSATTDETFFDGPKHFEQFTQTNFKGASGTNIYDSVTGSRIASSARFTLLNVHEDTRATDEDGVERVRFQMAETDVFQESEWKQVIPIILNDGTSIPPPDLPPIEEDRNYIGRALRILGLTMSGIIIALSIAFALWTTLNRKDRVVRASQPIFLLLVCAGCSLMGMSLIFLSFDDEILGQQTNNAFCVTFPWFISFGWILTFAALFTKTNRVNQIFHNPNFKRIKVTVWDVMKPIVVLVTTGGIILTCWTVLDPPNYVRVVSETDIFARTVETQGYCSYEDGLPWVSALAVVLLAVLVYALYEAYVARKISTEFAESEYIFLVLTVILVVSFLGIPVMILAKEETKPRYFVAAAIIFIVCMAILLLIFVPKIKILNKREDAEVAQFVSTMSMQNSSQQRFGAGRVSVSGFERAPTSTAEQQTTTHSEKGSNNGEPDDEDEGIRVIQYPGQLDELKNRIRYLETKNSLLQNQMKDVQNGMQAKGQMNSTEVKPLLRSVDMVGAIRGQ